MPNHIDNVLSVVGPPDEVTRFAEAARGRPGCWDDTDGRHALSMDALVPLDRSRPDHDTPGGQEAVWGVKWGAYGRGRERTAVADPGCVTYAFRTAWGPPVAFLRAAAGRFPAVALLLSYAGEDAERGRLFAAGGQWWDGRERPTDEDRRYDPDEGPDPVRRRTHPLWVGLFVASRAGYPFPADRGPVLADWLAEWGYDNLAVQVRGVGDEPVGPMPPESASTPTPSRPQS